MNSNYTPSDVAHILEEVGNQLVWRFGSSVLTAGLYGVFFTMSVISTYIQWHKVQANRTWLNVSMLLVIFVLFACATACMSLEATISVRMATIMLFSKSNYIEPLHLSMMESRLAVLEMDLCWCIMTQCCVRIADFILAWRACVLWSRNRKVVGFLLLMCLFAFAGAVWSSVETALSVKQVRQFNGEVPKQDTSKVDLADSISYLSSLIVNWSSTFAIACKLWIYKKQILPYIKASTIDNGRVRVYSILAFLVESGLFFGAYQLSLSVFCMTPASKIRRIGQMAYQDMTGALSIIAGINPVLTIILVNKHYSVAGLTRNARQAQSTKQNHLVFAPPTFESTLSAKEPQVNTPAYTSDIITKRGEV